MSKQFPIHLTARERFVILLHARSGVYSPKGHTQQAQLFELLECIGMGAAADAMDDGIPPEVAQRSYGSRDEVGVFMIPKPIIEFFLGKLTDDLGDRGMAPTFTRVLWPVIERMKSTKRDEYKTPDDVLDALSDADRALLTKTPDPFKDESPTA